MSEAQGDCFEANANFILQNCVHNKNIPEKDIVLCHGKVIGSPTSKVAGKIFVHAWIELGDVFMDYSNGNSIVGRKEKVYATGRILKETVKRYTPHEVCINLLKHKHYGAWDESLDE